MAEERLQDLIARLDRERGDADRDYNPALTGVDRAALPRPELPHPPPPYDEAPDEAAQPALERSVDRRRA